MSDLHHIQQWEVRPRRAAGRTSVWGFEFLQFESRITAANNLHHIRPQRFKHGQGYCCQWARPDVMQGGACQRQTWSPSTPDAWSYYKEEEGGQSVWYNLSSEMNGMVRPTRATWRQRSVQRWRCRCGCPRGGSSSGVQPVQTGLSAEAHRHWYLCSKIIQTSSAAGKRLVAPLTPPGLRGFWIWVPQLQSLVSLPPWHIRSDEFVPIATEM